MRTRAALRWLESGLHLGIVFQSQSDQEKVSAKVPGGQHDECGEGLILGTCIALKRKNPTILLTEDQVQGNKARALGISVASCAEVKERLTREEADHCPRSDQVIFPIQKCSEPCFKLFIVMSQMNEEWVEGEAKLVLRELLEAVLVQVFNSFY